MGKKAERAAKEKSAALEEEARNAARKEHGEEEYQCSGLLEQDFAELCGRAGFQEIPRVLVRGHPHAAAPAEDPDHPSEEVLLQIQNKFAFFRPAIQVELEHEDPKSTKEIFIRSWKIEEKMLSVLAKCLPALTHLQGLHLWKVGLTDATFLMLLAILPTCPTLKVLALEGNPLPERSFHRLISEEAALAHISLRNDDLDDEAALLMGQALCGLKASNKALVSINLSYNHITDEGARHLAHALRLNRSLLSLSLSHNRIGDEGALTLAEVLGPFALSHAEVVERRRLLLEKESQERCRMRSNLIQAAAPAPPPRHSDPRGERPMSHMSNTALEKLQPTKPAKAAKGAKKEPAKKEEKVQPSGAGPVQASAPAKKEDPKQAKKGPAAPPPEEKRPLRGKGAKSSTKDKRAQVVDVEVVEPTETLNPLLEAAEHREGKVFLPGNRVLIYLNLNRNQITEAGLKAFLATVEYQHARPPPSGKGPSGLLRLSLAKNSFPPESKVFARIQELMALRDPLPRAKVEEEQA